jgi:3-oxoacyl-[acyl-carrier protein] reductase
MKKNILITGVSRGLGFEITRLLLENNYRVYGIDCLITDELKNLIDSHKPDLLFKIYDLNNIAKIKKEIFTSFIDLDIPLKGFVNNAAIAYDDLITNIHIKPLEMMYKVNVFAPMVLTKYAIRNMLYHRISGSLVHISSISVHTGYKGLAMYASTKGALEAFSKTTAREWGKRGIRSNCIVAGFMETPMSSSLSHEQKDRIYKRTSLKKPTNMKSIAEMILFLLSDKSISITGQNMFVDSGTI